MANIDNCTYIHSLYINIDIYKHIIYIYIYIYIYTRTNTHNYTYIHMKFEIICRANNFKMFFSPFGPTMN